MAYKFQLGSAILSGSTKFEEEVDAAGGIKLSGVGDTALDVSADSFLFRDADGTMKRDTMADYATAIAGDGLAASSGVLAVGVDDSTVELNSDALRIKDSGVTAAKLNTDVISAQVELAHADIASDDELMISDGGVLKKVGLDSLRDHYYGQVSGDATIADGGALTIGANAVEDSMVNDNVATGLAGVGLSAASGVLALDASELSDAAVASGDKFVFHDATDDSTKKESVDDIATLFAGAGLAASSAVLSVQVSGALKVDSDKVGISGSFAGIGLSFDGGADAISGIDLDLNELTAGAIADGDFLAFVDANDSNVTKKEAVADLATLFAGSGLVAASSVMAVNVDDTGIEIDSDVVRLKDNGVTLAKMAGLAAAKFILGDSNGDPAAVSMSGDATLSNTGALTIAAGAVEHGMLAEDIISGQAELLHAEINDDDEMMIDDAGTVKKVGVDSLRDHFFGVVSGDATVADGGALTIAADAVESGMLNDNVISGQTDIGAAIADTDELLISDAGSLRRTDVSRLRAMAVAERGDGDTLASGMNFFGDLSSNATVSLPASPEVGDKVVAKAKGLTSGTKIIINKAGSQTIDGEASVEIESPYGAVTMVYVNTNDWRLI